MDGNIPRGFQICIDNVSFAANISDIRHLFSDFGSVEEVTMVSHFGYIRMRNDADAIRAVYALDRKLFFNERLKVFLSEELDFMHYDTERESNKLSAVDIEARIKEINVKLKNIEGDYSEWKSRSPNSYSKKRRRRRSSRSRSRGSQYKRPRKNERSQSGNHKSNNSSSRRYSKKSRSPESFKSNHSRNKFESFQKSKHGSNERAYDSYRNSYDNNIKDKNSKLPEEALFTNDFEQRNAGSFRNKYLKNNDVETHKSSYNSSCHFDQEVNNDSDDKHFVQKPMIDDNEDLAFKLKNRRSRFFEDENMPKESNFSLKKIKSDYENFMQNKQSASSCGKEDHTIKISIQNDSIFGDSEETRKIILQSENMPSENRKIVFDDKTEKTLLVEGISKNTFQNDLYLLFKEYGKIENIFLNGCNALVKFIGNNVTLYRAISDLNNKCLKGNIIKVSLFDDKKDARPCSTVTSNSFTLADGNQDLCHKRINKESYNFDKSLHLQENFLEECNIQYEEIDEKFNLKSAFIENQNNLQSYSNNYINSSKENYFANLDNLHLRSILNNAEFPKAQRSDESDALSPNEYELRLNRLTMNYVKNEYLHEEKFDALPFQDSNLNTDVPHKKFKMEDPYAPAEYNEYGLYHNITDSTFGGSSPKIEWSGRSPVAIENNHSVSFENFDDSKELSSNSYEHDINSPIGIEVKIENKRLDILEEKDRTCTQDYDPSCPTDDVLCLTDVLGTIQSIENKVMLIYFNLGGEYTLAKFIPGQMYVNGKKCLGYVIKNLPWDSWPVAIKKFLQIGKEIYVDLKKSDQKEIFDRKDSNHGVKWSVTLAWKGTKPAKNQLIHSDKTTESKIYIGTLTQLYPQFGVLSLDGEDIIFEKETLILNNACNKKSLLTCGLKYGDVLAAYVIPMTDWEIVEKFSKVDLSISKVYKARVTWQASSDNDVDPYMFLENKIDDSCNFIATSSTLNKQLPQEKDADKYHLKGFIQEIHLPAGGIIQLYKKQGTEILNASRRSVYFHRSRIYINGNKVQSKTTLDSEIFPGDEVFVDVLKNDNNDSHPYVFTSVYWVATSVMIDSKKRGSAIQRNLIQSEQKNENVYSAKIIKLEIENEDTWMGSKSGHLVITSGKLNGMRYWFDRKKSFIFGFPLIKSDLLYVFHQGEDCHVRLNNSKELIRLWIGYEGNKMKERDSDLKTLEKQKILEYLASHNLTLENFQQLIKGNLPMRPFIPLKAFLIKGEVIDIYKSCATNQIFDMVVFRCDFMDRMVNIVASRKMLYIYGRWLGQANLLHIIQGSWNLESELEFNSEDESFNASLAYIGARPQHFGSELHQDDEQSFASYLCLLKMNKNTFNKHLEGRASGRQFNTKDLNDMSILTPSPPKIS